MSLDWASLQLTPRGDGTRLDVHVKPRASRTALVGVREGALAVAVAAPPVDGAANDAVVALLARRLGVAKRDVVVAVGESSRSKIVEVHGIGPDAVRARLAEGEP